jgi:TolA-binding protein
MSWKHIANMLVMLILCTVISAQQTFYHTGDDNLYRKGMELYQNGKYSAAQQLFDKFTREHEGENSDLMSNCDFYAAMCALKLFNNDAEGRMVRFLDRNPENPLRNEAMFTLAGYFYQRKSYNNALTYYEKVDYSKLSKDAQAEFHFKSGHCYFLKEDYMKARSAFSQIKDIDTKYTSPALYYYSHINYTQGNYETALEGFLRLKNDANFGPIVPYYLTQIYFKQKKYNDVVKYASALMENVTEKRGPELARIIGESYAQLNLYEESIPYYEKYMQTASSVSREDKYSMAYAYYKTGNYEKAANLFGQITGSESAISQNALYHLADCQIRLNDKNKARMAFSSASKMEFDADIREDALFNYALLTYELDYSPFNESVQALNEYLNRYPNSKRSDEATNHLVMAYLNAKNYSMAMASIDKIRNMSIDMQKAYQKIAYYRGLELFNDKKYAEAVDMFNSSGKYGILDKKIYALSHYWKGEAFYRTGEYGKAIESYNTFLAQPGASGYAEYPLAQYNLGYAYFSLKQYTDAALWFSKFTANSKNQKAELVTDAYNRLGDCYFVQTDYARAIINYDNAGKTGKGTMDYALFQKGVALGVTGKDNEKTAVLNQLLNSYPNSAYKADVYYQLAESYVKINQSEKAITNYRKVVNDYPKSSYVKKSLLGLGILYYNLNRNSEAITCYKKIIEDYPGTDEADNALIGLKNVYVDNNDVDGYFTYMKGKGVMTSEDLIEQDSLSYLTAEKIYMTGEYARAAESLKNYIEKHPDGKFLLNAHFYKGDCNYRANEYAEALTSFDYIISHPQSRFTEPALLGASRIKFRLKDYDAAAGYYEKLEEVAEVKSNLLEARMGLIKCYSLTENYEKVIELADRILLTERLSPEQERETRFAKAKALQARDRQMLALEEYKKVATEVKSAEGAESKYRIAEIYYQRKEIESAEKVISDFANKTTSHQYWMGKSFLLWADIFRDKGDDFQAIQTLQSLIDYYEVADDGILAEAKAKRKLLADKQNVVKKEGTEEEEEIQIKE